MWDLVGNPVDRFSHKEAHKVASTVLNNALFIGQSVKDFERAHSFFSLA